MKTIQGALGAIFCIAVAGAAQAHTLRISCRSASPKLVTCAASYSDGEAAAGAVVRVVTEKDKVLNQGKTDLKGHYSFAKPAVDYTVVLQAGPHHITNLSSEDIK